MKKVNVSTSSMAKFPGKWIVIDPVKERIIAVGENLEEISPLVTHTKQDKHLLSVGKAPYSYLVPRKDEGPYILWINLF